MKYFTTKIGGTLVEKINNYDVHKIKERFWFDGWVDNIAKDDFLEEELNLDNAIQKFPIVIEKDSITYAISYELSVLIKDKNLQLATRGIKKIIEIFKDCCPSRIFAFHKLRLRKKKKSSYKKSKNSSYTKSQNHTKIKWDAFVCHAGKNKNVVTPFVTKLKRKHMSIWYDDDMIIWGDNLFRTITYGLKNSRFGIVIFSRAFLNGKIGKDELDGLYNLMNKKKILVILYRISRKVFVKNYPLLSGLVVRRWTEGQDKLSDELKQIVIK